MFPREYLFQRLAVFAKSWCAILFTVLWTGCGSADPEQALTSERLKGLATAYLDYAVSKGIGPANEAELRRHFHAMPAFALGIAEMSERAIDELLVSARDGQPFVIQYGSAICLSGKSAEEPIAFERVGHERRRFVAFADGHVECVDEAHVGTLLGSVKGF